jgi:regulator of sigma E protease
MNWFLIFLGFSALIILHEAGHFVAAKATGMRVERFFLFFPPKLVSVKRGETEYGIGAIPAGGFVKITGMNPDEELPPEIVARGYYHQPVWKRIVVIGAGPVVNIAIALALFFALFLIYGTTNVQQTVGSVEPHSPAAGLLRPGDEIVAVGGRRYSGRDTEARLERFVEDVASHRCPGTQVDGCRAETPVVLTVRRNGETRTVTLRPEYDASVDRTRIGISYGDETVEYGVGGAARESLDTAWLVASKTVTVFGRLFEEQQRKQVSGIVGVSDVANEAIDVGTREALTLVALVSLSLGLINLFPFLPLDGGHIFWSLVEKVRGRPVPFRVMERAGAVGFVLVILLFFIGLSNDIGRISGDGLGAR